MRSQMPMPIRPEGGWFEIIFGFTWLVGFCYGADTFGWVGGLVAAIGIPVLVFGAVWLLVDKK
jgi:uncharacterized membrane protein